MRIDVPDGAIDADGLGKRFGMRWVLRGVTFSVASGEVAALMGPNGSGKSTVLRILATLLKPNAGSATVSGLDIVRDSIAARAKVGYLAHSAGLYEDLTARENLRFAADMLGIEYAVADSALERVGLSRMADARVRGFSAGMQRRLALGRLLMRDASILLLDEPYSNLDEEGVELMNRIITDAVRKGGTALLALHELAPATSVLDRTLTLADGRIANARGADEAGHELTALAESL